MAINELLRQLQGCLQDSSNLQLPPFYAGRVVALDEQETEALFRSLAELATGSDDTKWPSLYLTLLGNVNLKGKSHWPGSACIEQIVELYKRCPADHPLRNQLLALLANINSVPAMQQWLELLCGNPPMTSDGINQVFQPLLASEVKLEPAMLRRLIDEATGSMYTAAAVYDLANHAVRAGKVDQHPAHHRGKQIGELLGALIHKLSQIEDGNLPGGESPATIAETISNAVSLIVALIDTVALLRVQAATGKLRMAAELKHRRIQVEAAAALALLDDDWGKRKLIECVAEPSTRQRAMVYAKELGLDNQISLEFTGPIATAESYLAMWLAMPEQMGLAPTEMKLLDQRKLYWPGYEDQLDCFLFEYRYGRDENAHANVGISGPAVHAFSADLTPLSIEDQYAAFAGWQTLSEEIYLIPMDRAETMLASLTERLRNRLEKLSPQSAQLEMMVSFFGSHALIASINRDGQPGTVIVDEESVLFIPEHNQASPIDWRLALDIWKGRKLLSSFNPAFSD